MSLVCGSRQWLESATPHHQRRPLQRGRWHRQKDKDRSPSAKKPTPVGTWYFTSAHNAVLYWISTIWCGREVSRPYHAKSFRRFDTTSLNHVIIRGFSPWNGERFLSLGKVDSPRKRVAEGLCGWRYGNSFPMTQSAQSHCQMRSIPRCSKAVFYVFVFWFHSRFGNNAYSIPRNFPQNRNKAKGWVWNKASVYLMRCTLVFFLKCVGILTQIGH